jgi:2-dehydro-3-deoxyphosphogluconate aldolase/(4S)-4-hydroxy-2-oxoglutarate aldolase
MARYRRIDVLNAMYSTGIVPVFYHPDVDVVTSVARACARGGARLLAFTNRGDLAWAVFRELERLCAKEPGEMITGAGSVVDPGTATLYINNGASFVVGPVLNPEVDRACNRRKIPYSPGCGAASEISAAEELGCEIVNIFPGAEVGGPPFVKALLGPCPWTSIMPTGGVEPTEASLSAWFKAGDRARSPPLPGDQPAVLPPPPRSAPRLTVADGVAVILERRIITCSLRLDVSG